MLQTAIFVDAGYLYAQGASALRQAKTPRHRLRLNIPLVVEELVKQGAAVESEARLLRIYWYDGLARGGQLNQDQRLIADTANVKCRFGTINRSNEQKGVDSLIVTDLIELARGRAITDALILSGDEDIRVGVQVAQTFGIRVHVLGIQPARGSQSPDLLAEADTNWEWGANAVERWLTVLPEVSPDMTQVPEDDWMTAVIRHRVGELDKQAAGQLADYAYQNGRQLPREFDSPSLAIAGNAAGRELTPDERKDFRAGLLAALIERSDR